MTGVCHGWRRKMGCALLVVSLALMMGWLRSYVVEQYSWVPSEGILTSAGGHLGWTRITSEKSYKILGPPKIIWRHQFIGFESSESLNYGVRIIHYQVAYWAITMPLTLLSGFLILWAD